MQKTDKKTRNRIIIAVSSAIVFLLLIVVASIIYYSSSHVKTNNKASVNLDASQAGDCATYISQSTDDTINTYVYSYIKIVNAYNNVATQSKYSSTIRSGSCKTTKSSQSNIYNISVDIDVPGAKQSWKVSWSSADSGDSNGVGLSQISVSCLPIDQLKYGDFNCQAALSHNEDKAIQEQYSPNGNVPGYSNFNTVEQGSQAVLSDQDIAYIQDALNNQLASSNQTQQNSKDKVILVSAVSTNSAQPANQGMVITTSFQVQFITDGGSSSTHDITYTLDTSTPYFTRTVTLDGQKI